MALSSIKILLLVGVLGIASVHAQDEVVEEMTEDYLTLASVEVTRVEKDILNQEISERVSFNDLQHMLVELPVMDENKGNNSPDKVGGVIKVGRELVALGEDIYKLVQKGKPSNTTSYAPISVIPKVGDTHVDIFETENWTIPRKNTYVISYKNLYGMEVVKFRYSVIYSYGGTYKGKGAYITAAMIVPESIMTSFGFTFSATMKLNGIMNHGTKENPVAGAIMAMEYTVETFLQASLESDSYHVTGRGGFKQL
ncbi:MAG: hypothetical protein H0V66_04120 [Bdellovibrionales bacterium]|nr:hypothetical protein [Bdellovibrionales bacterium]